MKDLLINKEISLKDAIDKLNKLGTKTLVISDEKQRLLGTISDGDIRKAIIKGFSLNDPITNLYNSNPKYVIQDQYTIDNLKKSFLIDKYDLMPEVNKNNILRNIIFVEDILLEKKIEETSPQEMEVIIMAGGFGKRLLPDTEHTPKPMLKIGDLSMIEIVIENFKKYGFLKFTISVHYLSEKIISHLGDGEKMGVKIEYIEEEIPLGTAGSLSLKKDLKDDCSYLVVNSDVLIDIDFKDLIKHHEANDSDITICTKFHEVNIPYGVVNSEETVLSIEEKPNKIYWVNSGLYVIKSSVMREINNNEHLDMTELITRQIQKNAKVISFPVLGYWKDVGHMDQLDEVRNQHEEN